MLIKKTFGEKVFFFFPFSSLASRHPADGTMFEKRTSIYFQDRIRKNTSFFLRESQAHKHLFQAGAEGHTGKWVQSQESPLSDKPERVLWTLETKLPGLLFT